MAQQKYKSEPIKEGQKKSNIKHQSFGTQALPPPKPTAITKTNKPMAQETAVEWLVKEFNLEGYEATVRLAKQMEREQHGKTWDEAIKANENRGNVIARSICDFDDYYNETYSK